MYKGDDVEGQVDVTRQLRWKRGQCYSLHKCEDDSGSGDEGVI